MTLATKRRYRCGNCGELWMTLGGARVCCRDCEALVPIEVVIVQPTLPGTAPPECATHTLESRRGPMGRWWKRCTVCWVGVFVAKRRKR